MNYVMISPHFPSHYEQFVLRLKEAGHTVLGIGDEHFDRLSETLRVKLDMYYRVDSMEHYDQMFKALAYLSFSFGKIDRIESHNEHYLELEARLRDDFNVFGLKTEEILRIKSKSAMKEVFKKAKVPVVEGILVNGLEEALLAIQTIKFPIVAKPDRGVGAAHTQRLSDLIELTRYFQEEATGPTFLEPYIEGQIHTFDGLIDGQGKLVYTNSFIFPTGVMQTVNDQLDSVYYCQKSIPVDLDAYGRAIIKAYKLKERFFHIEFFRKTDGTLIALELNARPPGGISLDIFDYANDFDIYERYARCLSNEPCEPWLENRSHILYVGLKTHNDEQRVMKRSDIEALFGSKLRTQARIPEVFAPAIGQYAYVFKSESLSEILEIATAVTQRKESSDAH
jgi:hypothetical protein